MKLLDAGYSVAVTALHGLGEDWSAGTPDYMADEMEHRRRGLPIGAHCDVYSAGATLRKQVRTLGCLVPALAVMFSVLHPHHQPVAHTCRTHCLPALKQLSRYGASAVAALRTLVKEMVANDWNARPSIAQAIGRVEALIGKTELAQDATKKGATKAETTAAATAL